MPVQVILKTPSGFEEYTFFFEGKELCQLVITYSDVLIDHAQSIKELMPDWDSLLLEVACGGLRIRK